MTAELDAAWREWYALWLEGRGGEETVIHVSDLEDAFRSGWEEAPRIRERKTGE